MQHAVIRAALEGMGMAIGRPTVIGPELREGALVPVSERYSEVRSSSCLVATSTARRKPEVEASGNGFCRWPTTSVGPRHSPEPSSPEGGGTRNLARGGTSRYVGKVMTCRAPGLLPAGGTAKGEMPQTEPCQCDSMTGARPNRARRLVG